MPQTLSSVIEANRPFIASECEGDVEWFTNDHVVQCGTCTEYFAQTGAKSDMAFDEHGDCEDCSWSRAEGGWFIGWAA